MNRKSIWKNDKGAALILVIGCVALLSVIGALLIAKTANNREMKELERKAQQTFYEAESGSQELVTVLEAVAQNILEEAFNDMLLQYSMTPANERNSRLADYFETLLKTELQTSVNATTHVSSILDGALDSAADVQVTFGDISIVENTRETIESTGLITSTNKIKIENVTISYTGSEGQTSITTDIIFQAELPDIEGIHSSSVGCEFTDFALIGGDNVEHKNQSGSAVMTINGNVYAGGDLVTYFSNHKILINDAMKVLVKGSINAQKGLVNVDNTNCISSGYGVWAANIMASEGGDVNMISNVYVADDLTISGTNSSIVLSGNGSVSAEYLGYSGYDNDASVTEKSQKSSAIIINNAKDITLDLSGLDTLAISGYSYIRDDLWKDTTSTAGLDDSLKTANAAGVLQGESMAYKDMQAMYLVPAECLRAGCNPILLSQYSAGDEEIVNSSFGELNLDEYLDPSQKTTKRYIVLDGGATQFVYVYLNFANEDKAAQYYKDYMEKVPNKDNIKKQVENLGSSTIKLAATTNMRSSGFSYDGTGVSGMTVYSPSAGQIVASRLGCALAKQRYNGLFSTLSFGSATMAESDLIGNRILVTDALAHEAAALTVTSYGEYDFAVYNGDYTVTNNALNGFKGILVVDGDFYNESGIVDTEGLVIVTGNVTTNATTTFTANKDIVEALLAEEEVAAYFRGYGSSDISSYLSSEAIDITFENWQKN